MINPFEAVGAAKSYVSTGMGLLKNPTHLLGLTGASFLSDSTLERARGRSDPSLSCFWEIELPNVKLAEKQLNFMQSIGVNAGLIRDIGGMVSGATTLAGGGGVMGAIGSVAGVVSSVAGSVANIANKANSWVMDNLGNPCEFVSLDPEYVEEVNLVFREYSTRDVFRYGGIKKYVDATSTLGDLNLAFYVGDGNESFKYILNWMSLVMGPSSKQFGQWTGAFTPPSIYKHKITVNLADVNNDYIYSIDYIGCWPKSFSDVQLNSTGDRLVYNVTFSVDDVNVYGFSYVTFMEQLGNMAGMAKDALINKGTDFVKGTLGM